MPNRADHLVGHQFPPGICPNPGGKPKWWLTNGRVKDLISRLGSLRLDEVQKIAADPETPMMEAFMAKVYLKGHETGDVGRLTVLLDRTIGKPVEVVEQHNHDHADKLASVPQDKLLELLKQSSVA